MCVRVSRKLRVVIYGGIISYMKNNHIKDILKEKEYNFLKTNEHLGSNIILIGLGGSYAYGMEKSDGTSDLDIRGIALNKKEEILLNKDFEQIDDNNTDSVIYSFNKIITLLTKQNPNVIEILGLNYEHYLYLSDIGKLLLNNNKMFLSKICIYSFGNYASSQLRRMENKAARLVGQAQNEAYILKSINNARFEFKNRYYPHEDSDVKLYIDKSTQEEYDSEIFMDVNLTHYPLRDWAGMWNEMKSIVSSYNKIGMRNKKAINHNKLGKHMAHLLRLYMMCIDILEKEKIITYRSDEHELLMSIRNGEYLDDNKQPIPAFYDLLNEYEKRFEYAKANTSLPDLPDYKRINEFKMDVNERIVRGEIL